MGISETALYWLTLGALGITCLLFVAMTAVRLPGTWMIVVMAVAFDWWRGWSVLGGWGLAALAGAALVAEVVETLMSAWLAQRAGASKRAVFGAVIGGFVGAVFLTFLVPIPLVGSMVGALAGCFAGAALVELMVRDRLGQSARVGLFSAVGFALGSSFKVAIALLMSAGLIVAASR